MISATISITLLSAKSQKMEIGQPRLQLQFLMDIVKKVSSSFKAIATKYPLLTFILVKQKIGQVQKIAAKK